MEETSFLPLLLIVVLSFMVPMLLSRVKRLRLPIVVGEILAGIVVGRSGFNLISPDDPILELLAEFGFVFLMFLSGLEIDFSNIGPMNGRLRLSRPDLSQPVPLAVLTFGLTLVVSTIIGFSLSSLGMVQNPWMMALILSTTSLGVVLPVLKERGLTAGRFGQSLLISALVADFVTMLLITVLVAALSHGITFDILLVGLLFVAFFMVYRLGNLFFNRIPGVRHALEELSHATAQIKVRAAFAIMLLFVVLSQFLGAEIILGGFLAGAVVSLLRTPSDADLSHQLESIGFGFFIPIFFIKVGIDFNLTALLESPQNLVLLPGLLLAAVLVKVLPMLLYRQAFSWRETFAAGALLSARLSLIIAASAIGLRLGVISESVNSGIILVAIITVTLAPMAFNLLHPTQPGEIPQPIVVAGADELGIQVALSLLRHNEQVVLIDQDQGRLQRAHQAGLDAYDGQWDILEHARALVCTHNDTQENYQICRLARTQFGLDTVIAHVSQPGELIRFEQLGVTALNAALDQANLLVMVARNPALYELMTRTDDNKEVIEIIVQSEACNGKKLRDLSLPGDVLILALRRDGELLVPHGNTPIMIGDHLALVGSAECIADVQSLLVC